MGKPFSDKDWTELFRFFYGGWFRSFLVVHLPTPVGRSVKNPLSVPLRTMVTELYGLAQWLKGLYTYSEIPHFIRR